MYLRRSWLYPIKPTTEIAEEFGLSVSYISKMAKVCRVKKSHEFRSEINRKNGSVYTERAQKRTERRAKRVLKLLDEGYSCTEAAKRMGVSRAAISRYRKIIKKLKK